MSRSEQTHWLALGVPSSRIIRAVVAVISLSLISLGFSPYQTHWNAVIHSSSAGHPVSLGAQPELCADLDRPDGVLRISGEATANTLTNYPNVFQTADPARGVRLESGPDGTVGAAFHQRTTGLSGLSITLPIEVGRPWTFSLDISAGGTVTLQIGPLSMTKSITDTVLTCDRILVGGGFNSSRSLHGVVNRITFEGGTRTPRVPGASLIPGFGVLLLTWILAGTIAGAPRRRIQVGDD